MCRHKLHATLRGRSQACHTMHLPTKSLTPCTPHDATTTNTCSARQQAHFSHTQPRLHDHCFASVAPPPHALWGKDVCSHHKSTAVCSNHALSRCGRREDTSRGEQQRSHTRAGRVWACVDVASLLCCQPHDLMAVTSKPVDGLSHLCGHAPMQHSPPSAIFASSHAFVLARCARGFESLACTVVRKCVFPRTVRAVLGCAVVMCAVDDYAYAAPRGRTDRISLGAFRSLLPRTHS